MLAFAVFSFNWCIFFWPITSWHCGIKSGKRCQCKAFCETDSAESRRMQDKFFLSAYSWNAFHISLIKHNVWNESHYSKKSLQTLCYISRSKLIRLTSATSIAGVPLGNSRILILCDVKKKLYGKRVAEAFRICRKFIESIIFDSRQFARSVYRKLESWMRRDRWTSPHSRILWQLSAFQIFLDSVRLKPLQLRRWIVPRARSSTDLCSGLYRPRRRASACCWSAINELTLSSAL